MMVYERLLGEGEYNKVRRVMENTGRPIPASIVWEKYNSVMKFDNVYKNYDDILKIFNCTGIKPSGEIMKSLYNGLAKYGLITYITKLEETIGIPCPPCAYKKITDYIIKKSKVELEN